jgi:hypothetical protein
VSTLLRIVRFVLKALATLIALVVAAYLVLNVAAVISAKGKRAELSDQITARIAQELPGAGQRARAVADGIDAPPTHEWVAQNCDFSTTDAGWIVQDYREVCFLESVHVWKVTSESEARSRLGGFVEPQTRTFANGACHRIKVADSLGGPAGFTGSELTFHYLAPAAEGSRWCAPTNQPYQERRSVVGEIPALDDSRGWLVVVQRDDLVDEAIGCVHWSVLFCDNPFGDELAWGRSRG